MVRFAYALVLTLLMTLAAGAAGAAVDGAAWQEVLKGIESDLDRRQAEVDKVREALPKLVAEAQVNLAQADNQLAQSLILRGVAGRSPWALRTLFAHYKSVSRVLEHHSQKLELAKEHLSRIKDENATLRDIRRGGKDVDYNDSTVASLDEPGRKMEAIKRQVDDLKDNIDKTLDQFAALSKRVDEARQSLREDYIQVFVDHFFKASRPPLDAYGLTLLMSRSASWAGDYPRFLGPVMAWTDWVGFASATLAALAVFLVGGMLAARKMGVAGETRVRRGWPLLALGLAGFTATYAVPFTASHVVNLILVAICVWGMVILVRHRMPPGALDFFLGLYLLGSALQVLDLPAELICVVWPPVMFLASWNRYRAGRGRACVGLAIMGLVAFLGFGPQSVTLVQAWFLFRMASASASSIREEMACHAPVWLHYVYPLSVTLLAVGYVCWVLFFMGGPGFVDYVFGLTIKIGPAKITLDAAAFMALLFFTVRLALAWLDAFLERGQVAGKSLEPALAHTLSTMASYTAWVAWLLAVLALLGIPMSGLTWIASGLSVGVGFGLKDIINNFVSGLIILFGGSIKKGDVVQTGKTLGEVTNVSVRNTTVRTLDNSMVIIPNSSFLKGEIINWSYQDKRIRLTIPVSVAPGTKVKKVVKVLLKVAKKHEYVLADPPPEASLLQFGRYGLDFALYVWIDDFLKKFDVQSELSTAIDQELQENKITVAFQGIKVKYKPKGTEEAQREAARQALKDKRHKVFSQVRKLRNVHMRSRWGVTVPGGGGGTEG